MRAHTTVRRADDSIWHLSDARRDRCAGSRGDTSQRPAGDARRARLLVARAQALPPGLVTRAAYDAVVAIASPDAMRAPDFDSDAALLEVEAALLGGLRGPGRIQ